MMTERLVAVEPSKEETTPKVPAAFAGDELPILEPPADPPTLSAADQEVMRGLVRRAREEATDLTGPQGLLKFLTKTVIETALEEELVDHIGYDKHDPAGRNRANSRNGTRAKTVPTAIGPVEIEVPRDRDGTFEPVIVRKRQRRLGWHRPDRAVADRARSDHRRGRGALRRGLRRHSQQGHDLPDHRQGSSRR